LFLNVGEWGNWYTTKCSVEKLRYNISNHSEVVIKTFLIRNEQGCDNFDSNYAELKAIEIKNKLIEQINTVKTDLYFKIKQIETERVAQIQTVSSFSWLAILILSLLFAIAILNDLYNFIRFLQKNGYFTIKQRIRPEENIELEERENGPRVISYLRKKIIKAHERRWRWSRK
jgi:hypothetical protein